MNDTLEVTCGYDRIKSFVTTIKMYFVENAIILWFSAQSGACMHVISKYPHNIWPNWVHIRGR